MTMKTEALDKPVRVIVLTYNAEAWASQQIAGFDKAGLHSSQVFVVDSTSSDRTREIFAKWGAEILCIPKCEFNHGGTRQRAADLSEGHEILIYMTQDAVPADANSLSNLVRAFEDSKVGVAYGRQLPRINADPIEAHARLFNYPDRSETLCLADKSQRGSKVAFCSDSFAAYRRGCLFNVGGFPKDTFFAEDQIVAARMLQAGFSKAYVADARVYHSHSYSPLEDFRRYFDVGVFHTLNAWLTIEFGRAEAEGARFVKSEIRYLLQHSPLRVFAALLRTFVKYAGYRAGRLHKYCSLSLKRKLSASPYYWR